MVSDRQDGAATAAPSYKKLGKITSTKVGSIYPTLTHATSYRTHQDATADLFEYIEVFYNRTRRHSSLGFVSPERCLQDWINAQQTKNAAA